MKRMLLACGLAAIAPGCLALHAQAASDPTLRSQSGIASHYSTASGSRTASGQRLNNAALTAAHRTLPFGTKVRVTNQKNGQSVVVTINDRGPFIRGRVIDLTPAGAHALGFSGLTKVALEIEPPAEPQDKTIKLASAATIEHPAKPQDKTIKLASAATIEYPAKPQDKTIKLASAATIEYPAKPQDQTTKAGKVAEIARPAEPQESSAMSDTPAKSDKQVKREKAAKVKTAKASQHWAFLRWIFPR